MPGGPGGPWIPGIPLIPGKPGMPIFPRSPFGPRAPCGPGSPLSPFGPSRPSMPWKPGKPAGPGGPGTPGEPYVSIKNVTNDASRTYLTLFRSGHASLSLRYQKEFLTREPFSATHFGMHGELHPPQSPALKPEPNSSSDLPKTPYELVLNCYKKRVNQFKHTSPMVSLLALEIEAETTNTLVSINPRLISRKEGN